MEDFRMFILKPAVVMAAQVVTPPAIVYPLTTVYYDTVTFGAKADVKVNMTVIFGTAPGLDDQGRTRVVKMDKDEEDKEFIAISMIPLGTGDGAINIFNNTYITILNDYRVWSKLPWQHPDTDVWFKDGGWVPVENNTLYPPPIANAGGPVMGTIDPETGVYSCQFSGENSFAFDPAVTSGVKVVGSYLWTLDFGTITSGLSTTEVITAEFPPGFGWVHLRVGVGHDELGNIITYHTCHVPVFVRDPDDDESIDNFQIVTHRHAREGQTMTVRIWDEFPRDEYYDGTLVLVWNGEQSTPLLRDNVLMMGWLNTEEVNSLGNDTGSVTDTVLNIVDIAGRMRLLPAFTQIQKQKTLPDAWEYTKHPNMLYFLWYLLYWHSTVVDLADLIFPDYVSLAILEFNEASADAGDLYNQLNSIANVLTPDFYVNCSRQGQLYVVPDPNLAEDRDLIVNQAGFTDADIINFSYSYNPVPRVWRMIVDALIGDGTSKTVRSTQVPTKGRGHGIQDIQVGTRMASSGAVLDICEGHRFARINWPYGNFNITLVDDVNTRFLEPATHQWVFLQISDKYMSRRDHNALSTYSQRGLLLEVNYSYNYSETGLVITPSIVWQPEASGPPGELYIHPEADEEE